MVDCEGALAGKCFADLENAANLPLGRSGGAFAWQPADFAKGLAAPESRPAGFLLRRVPAVASVLLATSRLVEATARESLRQDYLYPELPAAIDLLRASAG